MAVTRPVYACPGAAESAPAAASGLESGEAAPTPEMDAQHFASTPEPPYYAVIFASRRNEWDPDGYAAAADRMLELAAKQPGFLGVDSARDAAGFGITVSYWRDEAAIAAWKRQSDHAAIRIRGRKLWYQHFEVRVAKVERAYAGPEDASGDGAA